MATLPNKSARVRNAIAALASALAHELEIHPDCIAEFCQDLQVDLAEIIDSPPLLCTAPHASNWR